MNFQQRRGGAGGSLARRQAGTAGPGPRRRTRGGSIASPASPGRYGPAAFRQFLLKSSERRSRLTWQNGLSPRGCPFLLETAPE